MARTEGGSPIERTSGSEMADVVSGEKKTVLNQGDVRDGKADMLRNVGTSNGVLEGGDTPRPVKGRAAGAAGKGSSGDGLRALGRKAAAAAADSEELQGMDKAVGTGVTLGNELRHPLSKSLRHRARKHVNPAAAASALGAAATDSDELRGMDSAVEGGIQAAKLARRGASRYSQARVNATNAARGVQAGSAGTDAAKSVADSTKGKRLGDKAAKKTGKKASKKAASALNAEKTAADKTLAHMATQGVGGATVTAGGMAAGGAASSAATATATASAIITAAAPLLMPILLIIVVLLCLSLFMCGGAGSQDGDEPLESEAMPAFELQEYLSGSGDDKESDKYQDWAGADHGTAWCGIFQAYSAEQVGLTLGTDVPSKGEAAAAASWVTWFQGHKTKGTVYAADSGYEPQVGDMAVRYNKRGVSDHVEVVAATDASDCAYVEEIINAFSPSSSLEKKRKAHLKDALNDVVANKGWYLSVGGNTGDSYGSGRERDSLGAKAKQVNGDGRWDATHFVHIDMPITGSGNFKKYQLTNDEVRRITNLCLNEQGGVPGVAFEASLVANKYQIYRDDGGKRGLLDVLGDRSTSVGGFFAESSVNALKSSKVPSKKYTDTVRKVICEGKRACPAYIDEHDGPFGLVGGYDEIKYIEKPNAYRYDRKNYVPNQTIIHNRYGSTYTFYCWAPSGSNPDPFGYTAAAYKKYGKYGDKHYNYK